MAKKTFYRSLARRILLVTVVLIVIPIGIFSFLSWERDWRIRLSSTFGQLELIGNSNLQVFEEWYHFRSSQLSLYATLPSPPRTKNGVSIFELKEGVSKKSSSAAMVGKPFFYRKGVRVAEQEGSSVFVAKSPYSGKEEIFLLRKVGDTIWGLSESIENWAKLFSAFRESGYPITLYFVGKNDELLYSPTTGEHAHKADAVFSMDQVSSWKTRLTSKEIQALRGEDIALRIPLSHALFDLQIEIPAENITHTQGRGFFAHLLLFFVCFLLLGILGTLWLVSRMARPLNRLYGVLDAAQASDYSKRYEKDAFGFEINDLGRHFNQMLDGLVENLEYAKNEQIARELQSELLPKTLPQFPGLKIGGGFLPAKNVGGDFYDLFPVDEEQLFLTIADGSDKGISACLYALMVRSILRSHAMAKNDLETIVMLTNQLFCRDTGMTGNFVTAWVALFNQKTRELVYTSAGHCPAILVGAEGTIEELGTSGIALGVEQEAEVEVKVKKLDPGSLLFLYTDGVTEAHNKKGELFEKSRLIDFLKDHHTLESQALIDLLLSEIDQFSKEVPQHDDLTTLCLKA